jgi:hypothetical protein
MGNPRDQSIAFVMCVSSLVIAAGLTAAGPAGGAPAGSTSRRPAARPAGRSTASKPSNASGSAHPKPVTDQVEIRIAPFPGPNGPVSPSDFVLRLADDRGIHEFHSQNGKVSVRPGDYWLTGWTVTVPDAQGRHWKARGGIMGTPPLASQVPARRGNKIEIRLAAPLGTAVVPTVQGRTVNFVMTFVGTTGDRCYEVSVDDQRPPLPHMKILDERGQLVERLDFSFG